MSPSLSRGFSLCLPAFFLSCSLAPVRAPTLLQDAGHPHPFSPGEIRVAVWNLHKESTPRMVRELREWIGSNRADLVLLQELQLTEGDTLVSALGGRPWVFSANLESRDKTRRSGVLTASSRLCHEPLALLSEGTEPLAGTPKSMLLLHCALGPDTLRVANLHGLNFSPFLEDYRNQLEQLASRLRGATSPAIVAGDFNTWSRRKLDLTDSVLLSTGLSRLDFGTQTGAIESAFGNPLDHIYYTSRSLVPDTGSLRVDGQFLSSDHRALFAAFRLRSVPME